MNWRPSGLQIFVALIVVIALFAALVTFHQVNHTDKVTRLANDISYDVTAYCSGNRFSPLLEAGGMTLSVDSSSQMVTDTRDNTVYRELLGSAIAVKPTNAVSLPKEYKLLTSYSGEINSNPQFVLEGKWIVWERSFEFKPRLAGYGYGEEASSLWLMKTDGSEKRQIVATVPHQLSALVIPSTGEIIYLGEGRQLYSIVLREDGSTTHSRQITRVDGQISLSALTRSGSQIIFRLSKTESDGVHISYYLMSLDGSGIVNVTKQCQFG